MSRSLEDIIAECDRRMAECEIKSPTDEIKRLKEELARKERELDEIKGRMIESEKIVREYAIIQETKRRQEEEYFSKFVESEKNLVFILPDDEYNPPSYVYRGKIIELCRINLDIGGVGFNPRSGHIDYSITINGYIIKERYNIEQYGKKQCNIYPVWRYKVIAEITNDKTQKSCGICNACKCTRERICEGKKEKTCFVDLNYLITAIEKENTDIYNCKIAGIQWKIPDCRKEWYYG